LSKRKLKFKKKIKRRDRVNERDVAKGQRIDVRLEFPTGKRVSALPYVSVAHLFAVIHTGDGDFALADKVVMVDVVDQGTIAYIFIWSGQLFFV